MAFFRLIITGQTIYQPADSIIKRGLGIYYIRPAGPFCPRLNQKLNMQSES
jgi:hypothetical protein